MSVPVSQREAHEAFVSGHSGSSVHDLVLAVYPAIPASVIAVVLVQEQIGIQWFVVECILLVLPLVFSFTILANYTLELTAFLICIAAGVLYFIGPVKHPAQQSSRRKHVACVTSLRALTNLATAIAILAVDFHSFPRRYAKTEEYGYSLMDIGAAAFVVVNGIVEGKRRASQWSVLRDGTVLTILGILRLVLVWASDYQHHVTEYGVHGNFFFTLAFIKVSCSWWVHRIGSVGGFVLASELCISHQLFLSVAGGGKWTLSAAPRDTVLAANREWFVSLPGYMALYFCGAAIGAMIFERRDRQLKLSPALSLITVICGGFLICFHYCLDLPSRRLANPTFVALVLFFVVLILTNFCFLEEGISALPVHPVPFIFRGINRRPLIFFLLSNVCTGLVNKSVNTLEVLYPWDLSIIVGYTICIVSVVYYLYAGDEKKLKSKSNKSKESKHSRDGD